jgi:hypothetical protein
MLSRSLSFFMSVLVGCVALGGSAACTAEGGDDDSSTSQDALSEKSNSVVLAVANTTDEDTLDLDVGLSPGTARRIVNKRPFATITALRAVVTNPEVKLLLLYGQSQLMYGDAGSDAHADGGTDARSDAYADGGTDAHYSYPDAAPDAHYSYPDAAPDAH